MRIDGNMPGFDRARMDEMRQQRFSQADGDGNGSLNSDEFAKLTEQKGLDGSKIQELFFKADANGDGEISQDEMQTKGKGGGRRSGPRPAGPHPGGSKPAMGMISGGEEQQNIFSQLKSAAEDKDTETIAALLEELKSYQTTYSNSQDSMNLTSMLFDTEG